MKRTLIFLAVFAILATALYLFLDKKDDKIQAIMDDRNFAVPVEHINKVIIANREGKIETMELIDGTWMINKQYPIAKTTYMSILNALSKIRLQSIPPKSAQKNILSDFPKVGIRIMVYNKKDELLSDYYIGGVNQDETGTFYLKNGSNQPYVMEMPGMVGSTRGLFTKPEFDYWRDRAVFKYDENEIKKISVEYPKSKNLSFVLERNGNNFEVSTFYDFTPKINKKVNQSTAKKYFENASNIYSESFINSHPQRDSIVNNMVSMCNITIEDVDGKTRSVSLYPTSEVSNPGVVWTGPTEEEVIQRYFGNINDGQDFMLIQDRLIRKIMWTYDYFYVGT